MMTDFLLQFAIGNLVVALPLALLAYAFHRSERFPALAHTLWILMLVKLVTPPLMTIPLIPIPGTEFATNLVGDAQASHGLVEGTHAGNDRTLPATDPLASPDANAASGPAWLATAKLGFVLFWLVGGVFVLVRSLLPIYRFNRLLRRNCQPATLEVQQLAIEIAGRLGLRSRPSIYSVPAQFSPLVWWLGGRVRVVIPTAFTQQMDRTELELILAHELAHIKRQDHLVRWLEWAACVGFWWNPLVWWARRHLRVNEEICCDARVLQTLNPDPRRYANSLLRVVEFLSTPAIRPPAVACAMNRGGSLERRFQMIVSKQSLIKTPRWMRAAAVVLTLGLLPIGVAYGQDFNAVEKRLGAAVAAGEITLDQAEVMMKALRASSAHEGKTDHMREIEEKRRAMDHAMRDKKYAEAQAQYRRRLVEIEAAIKEGHLSLEEGKHKIEDTRRAMEEAAKARKQADVHEQYRRRMIEFEAAIKKGHLTPEEGKLKIEETRRALEATLKNKQRDDLHAHYKRRMHEVEAAIKAGHLTLEEGKLKIEEMHRAMEKAAVHDRNSRLQNESDLRKHKLMELEEYVKRAVEAGEMTAEEAEKKLVEARQAIYRKR